MENERGREKDLNWGKVGGGMRTEEGQCGREKRGREAGGEGEKKGESRREWVRGC